MGQTRASVVQSIESFLREAGLTEHEFGVQAVGDTKLLRRLRRGVGISLTTIERIEFFIDRHRQIAFS